MDPVALISSIIEFISSPWLWIGLVLFVVLTKAIKFVPQNRGFVIYTFGKYTRTLSSGPSFIIPFIEYVFKDVNMKEETIPVPQQTAITKDNITLGIDAVLYIKVTDASAAANNIENYKDAVKQLAMTTMRSAIGGMELDECFQNRNIINAKITGDMEDPTSSWGVKVTRYEIKDINVPSSIKEDMEKQMSAERTKRSQILEAEGFKESAIRKAEGEKQAVVLAAQAHREEQILRAEGEKEAAIHVATGQAKAIELIADAEAAALDKIGLSANTSNGAKAVNFKLAQNAILAHQAIAKESTIVLTDGNTGENISSTVAKSIAVARAVNDVSCDSKHTAN